LEQFFEAKKTVTLGDAFNYSGKSPEALAIYSHVQKSLDPSGSYPISEFPYEVTSNSDYDEFVKVVNRRVTQAQVLAQFNQTKTHKYGADNIYEYSDHTNAVDLKRDVTIAPVLSKPVLFDIAFNYIGYESTSDKLAPTGINDEESKKRGLFGFFGGR
jgi:signal recognition particle subunit SRP68